MEANSYISNFKRLVFIILMGIFLYCSIKYIGGVYSSVTNKNSINAFSNQRYQDFYALPENSLDIVFVGSSHSYCTFDPENFDSVLETSSFQLGMPLQYPDATYYTVKEIYNYQNPSLIIVEVYWDLLGKEVELKQALTLFDSLKNTDLEKEYVDDVFDTGQKIKYNMDILNYQNDYFSYVSKNIKDYIKHKFNVSDISETQLGKEYYRSKGYVFCDYNMIQDEFGRTNQFNGYDGRNFEINEKQRNYLKRLVELCNEKGTTVVFVMAPVANVSMTKISNYNLIYEQVLKMATDFGVPYIDYNMPQYHKDLFTDSNFRDDAHMNDSGVKILNADFIEWLIEKGIVEESRRNFYEKT